MRTSDVEVNGLFGKQSVYTRRSNAYVRKLILLKQCNPAN